MVNYFWEGFVKEFSKKVKNRSKRKNRHHSDATGKEEIMRKKTKNNKKKKNGRYFIRDNNKGESAPDKILRAARKVFSLHPFNSATTRMIAQAANVDHPLIHYYFGSKEKLFEVVVSEIYEEFHQANLSWLSGIERMNPRDGFSIYLDRLLEYNFKHPEPVQIILLNMAQTVSLEEIPGYQYIIMHTERIKQTLEEKSPLLGSNQEMKALIHCFNNLIITFLGARSCQAPIINMDPQSPQYKEWVKNTLFILFLPWLERIIKNSLHDLTKKSK